MSIIEFYKLIEEQGLEQVLREYRDHIAWDSMIQICSIYKFSVDFLREMDDYLIWPSISRSTPLKIKDIEEFKDKMNWDDIFLYQTINKDFINKYKEKISDFVMSETDIGIYL